MKQKIPIIFAATHALAVPLLSALKKDARFDLRLVITKTDKPAGRKMELTPSPIKEAAMNLGLPIFQPENINEEEGLQRIKEASPALMVVMAYGKILSPEILAIPSIACVNPHISILPKYRGTSPVQSALLNGDNETGVSLIQMNEGVDTGDVYETFTLPIDDEDNHETLTGKLAMLSAEKIPDLLERIVKGLEPKKQDEKKATHCAKISKKDGEIDWNESAEIIERKVRAFYGWPSSFTFLNGKRLKIIKAKAMVSTQKKPLGAFFEEKGRFFVQTGEGLLELLEVQIEGKKPSSPQHINLLSAN